MPSEEATPDTRAAKVARYILLDAVIRVVRTAVGEDDADDLAMLGEEIEGQLVAPLWDELWPGLADGDSVEARRVDAEAMLLAAGLCDRMAEIGRAKASFYRGFAAKQLAAARAEEAPARDA